MEVVQAWAASDSMRAEELEELLCLVESPSPRLETAECALALGDLGLLNIISEGLTAAEAHMLDLITARIEGDDEAMSTCIEDALLLVRESESRDLILEGRLRMERGLLKVQAGEFEDALDDLEWALSRLKSLVPQSHLHGLSLINKAAYHEHQDEAMMALHLYGEIPLESEFPPEIIAFSRIGAARIHAAHGAFSDAFRHLWNAHRLFSDAGEFGLAWHAGLEFLRVSHAFADPTAIRMAQQAETAAPRQAGEALVVASVHPIDLSLMAQNLRNQTEITESIQSEDLEFIDDIIAHCCLIEEE